MENNHTPARAIADEELNKCLARIQKRLGIEWGDFAGAYFSGKGIEAERLEETSQMLTDYIEAEREFRREGYRREGA